MGATHTNIKSAGKTRVTGNYDFIGVIMMKNLIDWPLNENRIRRGLPNHTFGMVRTNANGTRRPHQGWDFYAAPGTPCFAIASGRVAMIKTVGDYGNTVVLEFKHDYDGDGDQDTVFAAYSHLQRIDLKVGQVVTVGQQIGLTGNTGNAVTMRGQDCHLHFEARFTKSPGMGLAGRFSPLQLFGACPMDAPIKRGIK